MPTCNVSENQEGIISDNITSWSSRPSTLNSCLIQFKNDLLKVAYKSYQIIGIIIFTVQKRGICLHKTHSYEYKKKDALTHNNKLDKFWFTIWHLSSFKYHSNLLLMSSMSFRCIFLNNSNYRSWNGIIIII